MDLSVIIVNYNVKHFLEQCLLSVQRAAEGLEVEVIVVDNNSSDGSQGMVKAKFGDAVTLIENRDNPGFSRANNQGIAIAKGRHVLLLNPDTVVEEETFQQCMEFMDSRPLAGALGVKMIDGQGHFLPESKRGLPTPWVSFYKIFGLSKLFPKHKTFARYHLSYLDKEESHEVEVLSGAFMWIKKEVLDKIVGLDETFFMYGEDIDLSYRIELAGYQNYYFAGTKIIHYKGESTKKGSLNYVRVFYQAMIIFAQKHFGGRKQQVFIFFIRLAVYFRALLAILNRVVKRLGFPLIEAGLIYGIIQGIKAYWEHYVKYVEGGEYPPTFDYVAAPIYALVFVGLLGIAGAYKRPFRIPPIVSATFGGFVAIATVSYIFPEINFSRAIVGLSSIFAMIMALTTRGLINIREKGQFFFSEPRQKRVLIVGDAAGVKHIHSLLKNDLDYRVTILGAVGTKNGQLFQIPYLGTQDQLSAILDFYPIEEVIFDGNSLSNSEILSEMETHKREGLSFKILPEGTDFLVGSQSIQSADRQHILSSPLTQKPHRTKKRLLEVGVSLFLLASFPLLFWRYERAGRSFGNLLRVILGKSHMVGYIEEQPNGLPPLKTGFLSMRHRSDSDPEEALDARELDRYYARNYSWELDGEIVWKGWRKIGGEEK